MGPSCRIQQYSEPGGVLAHQRVRHAHLDQLARVARSGDRLHQTALGIPHGLFGDSFTFGEGVQNHESYPKILEELLNRTRSPHSQAKAIEVLNFGIGKTGTSHQLAFYQKEGAKYQLDLVIVSFFCGNDFSDNWSGYST
jgi:hypothetical protein